MVVVPARCWSHVDAATRCCVCGSDETILLKSIPRPNRRDDEARDDGALIVGKATRWRSGGFAAMVTQGVVMWRAPAAEATRKGSGQRKGRRFLKTACRSSACRSLVTSIWRKSSGEKFSPEICYVHDPI